MSDFRVAAMTRTFVDLHLRSNVIDQQATQRLVIRAAHFGYSQIAMPSAEKLREDEASKLKTRCLEAGVDLISRVDFYPRSENELTQLLRRYRRRFEVICVFCEDKEVARQAAKDHRVDLINFSSLDYRKRFFDRAEAELASNSLAALEVDVKPLLVLEGPPRVRLMMSLRREVATAREFKVPVVISSGVGEERLMRAPRDMASIGYLFGMDEASALEAVSISPALIIKRNREKLDAKFVAPGISIVKEGTDQ